MEVVFFFTHPLPCSNGLVTILKDYADKCHLLVNVKDGVGMKIGGFDKANTECEKLLGVKFDYKLTFNRFYQTYVKMLVERLMH